MSEDRTGGNRFRWLLEEDEDEEAPAPSQAPIQVPAGEPSREEHRRDEPAAEPGEPLVALPTHPNVPGSVGVPGRTFGSRAARRGRPKDPNALRNDPGRMNSGARIRRDVRKRVDQALADPKIGEEGTNYSLLVEALLVRWLDEVGYPMVEG